MERWYVDELAHAGAEHLDPEFVAGYDRKQGHPTADEDIEVLRSFGLGPDSVVLDMAAGTGQFALAASAAFGRVIAVDVSSVMVDHLERQVADRGIDNVTVVRGGFLSFEHDGEVDAVFSRNALHQVPDFWKGIALQRIAGWLRPGAPLRVRDLVYDFGPDEAGEVFGGWFANAATDPTVGYTEQDFLDHIRLEHSTFRWVFDGLLERAGFRIVTADYRARVYAAYTCVKE